MMLLSRGVGVLLAATSAHSLAPVVRTCRVGARSVGTLHASKASTDSARVDYANHIDSLAALLKETKEMMAEMKRLATELKELELEDPRLSDLGSGADAENLRKALAEAKAACDAFGPNSDQARVAWVELELAAEHHGSLESHTSYRYSAAALKAHHYYNSAVDAQLLGDSIKSLENLEALSHFVDVEKTRLEEQPWLTS